MTARARSFATISGVRTLIILMDRADLPEGTLIRRVYVNFLNHPNCSMRSFLEHDGSPGPLGGTSSS